MKILRILFTAALSLFVLLAAVYWFNLDTRLVKTLEKPLMRHYDDLPRDHRL